MDFERMLRYLSRLEENNNRTWFHENHDEYKAAKADFETLTESMKYAAAEECEPLADLLLSVNAKDMIYRVPRDARIYKSQPPYNPAFRAYIAPNRKALWPLGFFVMIQPGGRSIISAGAFTSEPSQLAFMREYVASRALELKEILMKNDLELIGEKLKKPPKGYDEDFEFVEYVKHKQWLVERRIDDKQLGSFQSFLKLFRREVRRMEEFRAFMNEGLVLAGGKNHW